MFMSPWMTTTRSLTRYRYVMKQAAGEGDELTAGPRKGLAAWTNEIAVPAAAEYPFLASLGDDMVPRTPGWDRALIRGIERMGGTGIVYPWDGIREDIPEAPFVSSDIVAALGWFFLPEVSHWYGDNAWPTWAAARAACGTCGPSPSTTSTRSPQGKPDATAEGQRQVPGRRPGRLLRVAARPDGRRHRRDRETARAGAAARLIYPPLTPGPCRDHQPA